jgi:hypothetical protein
MAATQAPSLPPERDHYAAGLQEVLLGPQCIRCGASLGQFNRLFVSSNTCAACKVEISQQELQKKQFQKLLARRGLEGVIEFVMNDANKDGIWEMDREQAAFAVSRLAEGLGYDLSFNIHSPGNHFQLWKAHVAASGDQALIDRFNAWRYRVADNLERYGRQKER